MRMKKKILALVILHNSCFYQHAFTVHETITRLLSLYIYVHVYCITLPRLTLLPPLQKFSLLLLLCLLFSLTFSCFHTRTSTKRKTHIPTSSLAAAQAQVDEMEGPPR
uniref:Uncharacterized protein n=1 Tax=Trypanosoma congolense (strain IL3000) TaxID=1068625 RepID=G0ULB5_TRYCI|nr:hypothetical protein, unlikely [Trypanosoma congolense IL3000]